MRMDDHRLDVAAMNHVRTGAEAIEGPQGKFKDYIDVQGKAVFLEFGRKMEEAKSKVDEFAPKFVEDKLLSIKSAIDAVRRTEEGMKELEEASNKGRKNNKRKSVGISAGRGRNSLEGKSRE